MSPVVIDLRATDDSRDVVHRAVQALAEGFLVAFPTETVYGVAASGLNERAVDRMASLVGSTSPMRPSLAVKSAADAFDYVPNMSPVARRLARRCWPGPVTLQLPDSHEDSLLGQLPQRVREVVAPDELVGLCVPAHQAILDVLRLLAGPIVLATSFGPKGTELLTAQDVLNTLGDQVQLVLDDGRSRYGQPPSLVRVEGPRFTVVRAGVVPPQTLKRLASLMILFVCTGNTCRSPMAEAMCRTMIAQRLGCTVAELEDRGVVVASAGLAATMGGIPTPEAVEVLNAMGIRLGDHEAQPVNGQLIRQADYIFTMTRSHRQAILAEWPDAAPRTFLLCRDRSDISDPIGAPLEQYQRCAAQIKTELAHWIDQLEL